jgi:hypothetical protein
MEDGSACQQLMITKETVAPNPMQSKVVHYSVEVGGAEHEDPIPIVTVKIRGGSLFLQNDPCKSKCTTVLQARSKRSG